jgi:hypothetical protein
VRVFFACVAFPKRLELVMYFYEEASTPALTLTNTRENAAVHNVLARYISTTSDSTVGLVVVIRHTTNKPGQIHTLHPGTRQFTLFSLVKLRTEWSRSFSPKL